jgi:hypothetical protein
MQMLEAPTRQRMDSFMLGCERRIGTYDNNDDDDEDGDEFGFLSYCRTLQQQHPHGPLHRSIHRERVAVV